VLFDARLTGLQDRASARTGHYMPASLVRDQCQQLELPATVEDALILDATKPLSCLTDAVVRCLSSRDKDDS
jgi:gluconate kinase